jgi:hypothetical protein
MVRGLPDVDEVAVFPDRLEVRTRGQWRVFSFAEIGAWLEPPWLARLKQRLRLLPYRKQVAELVYVREPYEESYFEFFTDPRLRVHMPAGDAPLYPDSVFWRIQDVLRSGGYAAEDPHYDRGRLMSRTMAYQRAHRSMPYGNPK